MLKVKNKHEGAIFLKHEVVAVVMGLVESAWRPCATHRPIGNVFAKKILPALHKPLRESIEREPSQAVTQPASQ